MNGERRDPIGDEYYKPLRIAEAWTERLFYLTALLSFAILVVDKSEIPIIYDLAQGSFILFVITVFSIGLVVRLYLKPRAEDMRRKDLLSKASGFPLTHIKTQGYYNNDEQTSIRFLGASIMESSYFSARILLMMVRYERIKIATYVLLFVIALLNRRTDLALAATAAVAIFSEQILSQWIRMEWLRSRCESSYDSLYGLFQNMPKKELFEAKVLELIFIYETSKANASITFSDRIFQKNNEKLSSEWNEIKKSLKI